jgi:hypothetical protein
LRRMEQRRHRIEELFRADPSITIPAPDPAAAPGPTTGAANVR